MTLTFAPLLVEKVTIRRAQRTLRMAQNAQRRGDMRLAVSRAITAAVQATRVSCFTKKREDLLRADAVIQAVRDIIQGVVLRRAARLRNELGMAGLVGR